jgi:hypothetical protein
VKSQQVGYVLTALILVGVVGLIFRIVAAGSDEITLRGLVQISSEASDKIVIRDQDGGTETELVRIGSADTGISWVVDHQPIFPPKLEEFWTAVSDLYSAQLVAINPANHTRMGISDGQGVKVSFFRGQGSLQEEFIVGRWKPEVRLCYIRRAGNDEVYGIPCAQGNVFDPNPDAWKNPIVAAIPSEDIDRVEFTYPDQRFALVVSPEGEWAVVSDDGQVGAADLRAVRSVIGSLRLVLSSGFADEDEAENLDFGVPDARVRIITRDDAITPSTRLDFLERDESSVYLAIPTRSTVFIVLKSDVAGLLLRRQDFGDG